MSRPPFTIDCDTLRRLLKALLCCEEPPPTPEAVALQWVIKYEGATFTFPPGAFMAQLPVDKVDMIGTLKITDSKGNPAAIDGLPVWAIDPDTLVKMTVEADAMSAHFDPKGPLGTTQVSVKVDADLGSGVKEIVGIGSIETIAGGASVVSIEFSEPTAPVGPTPTKK